MKRISFKDSGGLNLTQAVLSRRKTMTRRLARRNDVHRVKYEVGDVVAIQQSYKEVYQELFNDATTQKITKGTAGWSNKMFVRASIMPHHIRITDVTMELLQDISDEDCLREGIIKKSGFFTMGKVIYNYTFTGCNSSYQNPRSAFAALINKVSGRGTWDSNPLVFVYSFERVD